jgi:hypothetical protein
MNTIFVILWTMNLHDIGSNMKNLVLRPNPYVYLAAAVGQEQCPHLHGAVDVINGGMLQNKQKLFIQRVNECINTNGSCLNTYCNYIYVFNLF